MLTESSAPLRRLAAFVALEAIVSERVVALDGGTRAVLELAALLIRDLDPGLLAEALPAPRESIVAALERARAAHFLVSEGGAGGFRFAHALIRQAVRAHIAPARLPELHARLARALERRTAGGSTHELAYYWREAGVGAKSRHYDERAGDSALVVNAFADAAAHYGRALAAGAPGRGTRLRLESKLASALRSEGEASGAS
jgi:predicted ATPase